MTDDSSSTHGEDRTSPLRTLERGQQAPRAVQPGRPVPAPLQTLAGYSWRFLVIVGAVAVIVYLVIHLRLVVLPLVAALFLSTFLYPLVERLGGRGFKPAAAAGTVLAGALLFLALFIGVLAPQVGEEVGDMGQAVRQGTEQILSLVARPPLNISQDQVDTFVNRAFEQIQGNRERIASGLISGAVKAVEFIAGTLLCLVTLFFFLKDGPAMWAWFTGQFRADMQMHLRQIGLRVWATMGAYLRGISIIGFVEASIIGIVLFVLGVPLLIPLMLLQFFAAFFPVVGAPVAGTIAVLVALVSGGLIDAIIVAIAIMVIQQMDNHLLQPVIMGRSVKLHPVVVLLALTAGGIVAGFIGALLAVPTAAIASSIGNYLNGLRSHDTPSFGELQQERP